MNALPVDKVEVGMTAAADVTDRKGRVLLTAGTTINEKHLRVFRMWGVSTVPIAGRKAPEPPLSPELLQEVRRDVAQYFRHAGATHVLPKQLFVLCVKHEAKQRQLGAR